MALSTAFTRRFGLTHPIVLAPMGAVAGGTLAAAVQRAGGLGLIGAGYAGPEAIDSQFAAAGNQPVGIGFITWYLEQHPEQFDAAIAHGPKAIMFSFGDARPWIAKAKQRGARVICQVQSLAAAKQAAGEGADLIVAQGSEAGGHGGGRATLPLVPAIVDAVSPIPVLAAGGIADGRGLAAALTLGASGVLIGTRFIATQESLAHDATKVRLVVASGDHTLRTRIFDIVRGYDWPQPWTGRALDNEFTQRWHGREAELAAALDEETPRYWKASETGDLATALVWAGEGLDLIHDVPPASALVESLVADAERALAAAAALSA